MEALQNNPDQKSQVVFDDKKEGKEWL